MERKSDVCVSLVGAPVARPIESLFPSKMAARNGAAPIAKIEPTSPVSAKEPAPAAPAGAQPTPMVMSMAAVQPKVRSPPPPPPPELSQTPPFLTKLYNLVEDPVTSELVSWTAADARAFTVHKPDEFARDVLPRYFKHKNFSSFVRQLNQYGFHKRDPDRWTFGHENFRRGRLDLLKLISRRRPKNPIPAPAPPPPARPAPPAQQAVVELGSYGLAGKLEGLKRDKDVLIKELVVTRKAEKKLQDKCEGLELRVGLLENSTKQMQNFIMHYFSQVLQPYSEEIATRKRKRLPPAPALDVLDMAPGEKANGAAVGKTVAPPFAPSGLPNPTGESLEALRQMMQQMQMNQAAAAAPAVAETNGFVVDGAPHSPSPKFAPATVQELPLDESSLNGSSDTTMRDSQANIPPPPTLSNGNTKGDTSRADEGPLTSLDDILLKQAMEQAGAGGDAGLTGATPGTSQDAKVEAIEEFMDLQDDIDFLPPLTELPEGTDISALARQIQGFGGQLENN